MKRSEQVAVGTYYNRVKDEHGVTIATEFHKIMKEWNNDKPVLAVRYDADFLAKKLEQTLEEHVTIVEIHYGI